MVTIEELRRNTARENVERALEKAKAAAAKNAIISLVEERALARADMVDRGEMTGKLAGIPFIAKDNFLTLGVPTTAASDFLKDFISPIQATAIERLEAEGAICIGKANLDAFAHGGSTENSAFGVSKNAVDDTKVAGGSSGGSAVVVALGIVPFALGTDTGGSIRQPASFNGVVGVKPTYGVVSRFGVVAMASSTDTIGVLSASAMDAEVVMDIIAGKDGRDMTTLPDALPAAKAKPLTIGLITEAFTQEVDSDVTQAIHATVDQLRLKGHTVKEVSLSMLKYALAMYYVIVPAEISSNLARYDGIRYGKRAEASSLSEVYGLSRDHGFMAENKRRIMIGSYVLSSGYFDAYYLKAQKARTLLIRELEKLFESIDVLVTPVSPTTAFGIGEKTSDPVTMYLADIMTVPASLAGMPAMSVPVGESSQGLPIGMQIWGAKRADRTLYELAKEIEEMNRG